MRPRRNPSGVARARLERLARSAAARPDVGQPPATRDFGRAVVDRLVELGREVAEMRAALRSAREEAREARQSRDEAEQPCARPWPRRSASSRPGGDGRVEPADHARDGAREERRRSDAGTRRSPTPRWKRSSGCSRATTASGAGAPDRLGRRGPASLSPQRGRRLAVAQETPRSRRPRARAQCSRRLRSSPRHRASMPSSAARPDSHDRAPRVEPAALGDARRVGRLAGAGSAVRGRPLPAPRRAAPSCTDARGAAARPPPARSRRSGRGT